jgi:hypothetical protein
VKAGGIVRTIAREELLSTASDLEGLAGKGDRTGTVVQAQVRAGTCPPASSREAGHRATAVRDQGTVKTTAETVATAGHLLRRCRM